MLSTRYRHNKVWDDSKATYSQCFRWGPACKAGTTASPLKYTTTKKLENQIFQCRSIEELQAIKWWQFSKRLMFGNMPTISVELRQVWVSNSKATHPCKGNTKARRKVAPLPPLRGGGEVGGEVEPVISYTIPVCPDSSIVKSAGL
jgi:hypothetical protein